MDIWKLFDRFCCEHETGISQSNKDCWYKPAISGFEKYLGRIATINDLTDQTLTAWVDAMKISLAAATVKSRRNAILSLWRFAYANDFVLNPPKKVRKVKVPKKNPQALTPEQTRQLIDYALNRSRSKSFIPESSIPNGLYFASLFASAWDTALRFGDLLELTTADIHRLNEGGGILVKTQRKTGDIVRCRVSTATLRLIDESLAAQPRACIWPLWGTALDQSWRHRNLFKRIKTIFSGAGIPGRFHCIRRGAVTEAENISPGLGTVIAGHRSRDVTVRHYIDQTLIRNDGIKLPTVAPALKYDVRPVDVTNNSELSAAALLVDSLSHVDWTIANNMCVEHGHVAVADNRIIGYADRMGDGTLPQVYVSAEVRRNGIGRSLLKAIADVPLAFDQFDEFDGAERFLTACGFKIQSHFAVSPSA